MKKNLHNIFEQMFGADLRSLALLRVGIALITLYDLLQRLLHLFPFYSEQGVLTVEEATTMMGSSLFSLHTLSGRWEFQLLLILLAFIPAIFLLVGYKTRMATIVTWILLISIQARNPIILQGNDVLHRLILFWGIFLPWSQRFSIDAARSSLAKPTKKIVVSIAVMAYFLQISYVYIFNALHKTDPAWHENGTALYYALSLDQFTTTIGYVLYQFPAVLKLLTNVVWNLEMWGTILFFIPFITPYTRIVGVLLYTGMHIGIGTTMAVGIFWVVDIVSLTAFLPSLFWDKLFSILQKIKGFNITIYYDSTCGFCYSVVRIIQTFLLLPSCKISPASKNARINTEMQRNNSWVILTATGHHCLEWNGVTAVVAASPWLFWLAPILRIQPITTVGNHLYRIIATHRTQSCTLKEIPSRQQKPLYQFLQIPISIFLIFLMIYVFLWNMRTIPNSPILLNSTYDNLGLFLRLDQDWSMFSPFPLTDDGWYVAIATFADGSQKDIFQHHDHISWEKPKDVMSTYPDYRWRKYMLNLYLPEYADQRERYGRYLCNEYRTSSPPIIHIQIYFMMERTLPDYQTAPIEKRLLYEGSCPSPF